MEKLLNNYINKELLVHSRTEGKDLCIEGILREIRDDIVKLAKQVIVNENGIYVMNDQIVNIPTNDIVKVSNGQKVMTFSR